MQNLQIHLIIIGYIFIVLSLIHIVFPKRFQWKEELSKLSLLNRQMMLVHTFFIALFVMLNGLLFAFFSAELLIAGSLQRAVVSGLLIFWTVRGLIQHFFYSAELWRGKIFETGIHAMFSILWTYIIVVLVFILQATS